MQHRLVAPETQLSRFLPAVGLATLGWLVLLVIATTGNGAVIRHDRLLQGGPPLWLGTIWFVGGWQLMWAARMDRKSVGKGKSEDSVGGRALTRQTVWSARANSASSTHHL